RWLQKITNEKTTLLFSSLLCRKKKKKRGIGRLTQSRRLQALARFPTLPKFGIGIGERSRRSLLADQAGVVTQRLAGGKSPRLSTGRRLSPGSLARSSAAGRTIAAG